MQYFVENKASYTSKKWGNVNFIKLLSVFQRTKLIYFEYTLYHMMYLSTVPFLQDWLVSCICSLLWIWYLKYQYFWKYHIVLNTIYFSKINVSYTIDEWYLIYFSIGCITTALKAIISIKYIDIVSLLNNIYFLKHEKNVLLIDKQLKHCCTFRFLKALN